MSNFNFADYIQAIYNASNRRERRQMLFTKNRNFTKRGYVYGVNPKSKIYGLAEHYAKKSIKQRTA